MVLNAEQELLEHEMKVANMKADTELKRVQAQWEPWKVMTAAGAVFVSLGGVIGFFLGLAQHHH